ncbi:glycosyltransferase family 4 protein [Patescibacteria group bacterium]
MEKRKIGINASFIRKTGTGVGQVTINVLNELKNQNREGDFILYLEDETDLDFLDGFEKKSFLPFWKRDDLIRKILWEMWLIPKKIKKDNCKRFISFYQCPTIIRGVEHTMLVHDIIPKLFPEYLNNWRKKLYWKLTERAIKRADKIVAISENTKRDLVEKMGILESKIEVKYIDVDEIYKKEVSPAEVEEVLSKYNLIPGYIYSGGGLEKRKNIDNVIFAYKKLLKKDRNIPDLVISGKMMPELAPLVIDIERIVRENDLEERVRLLGFVDQDDLPMVYHNASVFVYPSQYEGFGMPVLEAMSQGVPVIAAKNSSIAEVGGDAVMYFETESVDDLVEKMETMLGDGNLRDAFSRKGVNEASRFSWNNFIDGLIGE